MRPDPTVETVGMTHSRWTSSCRVARRRIQAILTGRFFFVSVFGCVLLLNWGAALWVIHYTCVQRRAAALQMVNDEAQYSAQKIEDVFKEADRVLIELRARHADDGRALEQELAHSTPAAISGGIALIAPDGHVVAATPHASTAGWPRLMTRLATSADALAIGEPIPGKNGHLGVLPIARRIVAPDGSFGGILMVSLELERLSRLSPTLKTLDGCMTLVSDDDVILARTPEVRGTVGIRMTQPAVPRENPTGTSRHVSLIDGIDRIVAFRHVPGVPLTVVVGIGHDATFADWEMLRFTVLCTRVLSTVLISLAGLLWYSRRRRARISASALTAILTNIEHGVRVESRDGRVLAANEAGKALRMPNDAGWRTELQRPDGSRVQIDRHDLADGGTVLIGTDVTARQAAQARIAFLTDHDSLTGLYVETTVTVYGE